MSGRRDGTHGECRGSKREERQSEEAKLLSSANFLDLKSRWWQKMYIVVGADALLSLALKKPDEDRMKAVSAARKAQREQSTGITDHFILQILHQ